MNCPKWKVKPVFIILSIYFLFLTKAGSICAWLVHPENSGISEHLFSSKTFCGSGTFGCMFCQDCHACHCLSLSWLSAIALDFLEHVNECVDSGQGSGTVATVNCSSCQRGNDPFSDIDEKS